MADPRILPLYDPNATPSGWNERMAPGEFAVHFSHRRSAGPNSTACAVFPSLAAAQAFAASEVAAHPDLRCRIYDHRGFVGAPLAELTGPGFKGERDLPPRARLGLALLLLLTGAALVAYDALHGFGIGWPFLLGGSLMLPGTVLLLFELLRLLDRRHKARSGGRNA